MSEGGRRIAIGIDESDFAEQAFNCKYLPFFQVHMLYIMCRLKKLLTETKKKFRTF